MVCPSISSTTRPTISNFPLAKNTPVVQSHAAIGKEMCLPLATRVAGCTSGISEYTHCLVEMTDDVASDSHQHSILSSDLIPSAASHHQPRITESDWMDVDALSISLPVVDVIHQPL